MTAKGVCFPPTRHLADTHIRPARAPDAHSQTGASKDMDGASAPPFAKRQPPRRGILAATPPPPSVLSTLHAVVSATACREPTGQSIIEAIPFCGKIVCECCQHGVHAIMTPVASARAAVGAPK